MNKTHVKRFTELIAYLEQPDYPKHFNFNHFKLEADELPLSVIGTRPACSTSGCALGDCPTLFPKQWHFYQGVPALIGRGSAYMTEAYYSAALFFGMTEMESDTLFKPGSGSIDVCGKRLFRMPLLSTRFDVAKNLKRYLKIKKGVVLK